MDIRDMGKILRVFPRRTNATPDDDMVRIGYPDLFPPECGEIHISITFTYDLPMGMKMAESWNHIAPVKVGGPALDDIGGGFDPGMYLKIGNVITSRGCPNRCWFCMAARREGAIRELTIRDGWRVSDNNLLACSRGHVERVFDMLGRQKERVGFVGGLEPARMEPWIAKRLALLKPSSIYFAYDTPSDKDALASAILMMRDTGHKWGHSLLSYVLIGYPKDTIAAAEERLRFVLSLGVLPFAMLYRDDEGGVDRTWRRFQREWCRATVVGYKLSLT